MKVYHEKPNDGRIYYQWRDDKGALDVWYERPEIIGADYRDKDIPEELKDFLDRWCEKIKEYMKDYRELYPVKLAEIDFYYKDRVFSIFPYTVGATYESCFMSDEPYQVSWDSLFETYEREIRDDLEKSLGIDRSTYKGFLD